MSFKPLAYSINWIVETNYQMEESEKKIIEKYGKNLKYVVSGGFVTGFLFGYSGTQNKTTSFSYFKAKI